MNEDHIEILNGSSPFKLLDYYVENDAPIFGGRDREIQDIVSRIASRGVLVVYGPSGTGKTSLLRAGVFPQIDALGWRRVYVRTLTDPVQDLCSALGLQLLSSQASSPSALMRDLRRLTSKQPLLVVFDQFEEFFIRFADAPTLRDAFVALISEIARSTDIDCRILFCLRDDYFSRLDDLQRSIPNIFEMSYRVRHLTAYGTREAILKPLLRSGVPFDTRLINGLVDCLQPYDYDPIILQLICNEVVLSARARFDAELRLTEDDIKLIGSVENIFEKYLSQLLSKLNPDLLLLARLVLDALITEERTKRAMRVSDFLDKSFEATPEEVELILAALEAQRIVRPPQARAGDSWWELVHERLVQVIQGWCNRDQSFRGFQTACDLIRSGSRGGQYQEYSEAFVLTHGQVEELIKPFRTRLRLTETEINYVLVSCMLYQSESLPYWYQRVGNKTGSLVLDHLLNNSEAVIRRSAALAIRRLEIQKTTLIDRCFDLALSDEAQLVRRAAGTVVAALGGVREADRLKEALDDAKSRLPALELLADYALIGRHPRGTSFFSLFRARRLANKRLLDAKADLRLRRSRIALLTALVSSVAWCATICIILLWGFLYLYMLARDEMLFGGLIANCIVFVIGMIFGLIIGMDLGRAGTRRDILGRPTNWAADIVSSIVYWAIPVLFVSIGILFEIFSKPFSGRLAYTALSVSLETITWICTLPAALWIGQRSTDCNSRYRTLSAYALVLSVLFPLLISIGLNQSILNLLPVGNDFGPLFFILAPPTILLCSVACFVALHVSSYPRWLIALEV
jgi:hypothetical protein